MIGKHCGTNCTDLISKQILIVIEFSATFYHFWHFSRIIIGILQFPGILSTHLKNKRNYSDIRVTDSLPFKDPFFFSPSYQQQITSSLALSILLSEKLRLIKGNFRVSGFKSESFIKKSSQQNIHFFFVYKIEGQGQMSFIVSFCGFFCYNLQHKLGGGRGLSFVPETSFLMFLTPRGQNL